MFTLRFFTIAITCGLALASFAQSPFQDVKGKGSILLPGSGGFAQLNFQEASATLGFRRDTSSNHWFGLQVTGKPAGSTTTLFGENRLAPSVNLLVSLGQRWVFFNPSKLEVSGFDPSNADSVQKAFHLDAYPDLDKALRREPVDPARSLYDPSKITNFLNGKLTDFSPAKYAAADWANDHSFDWAAIEIGVSRSQYRLVDSAQPFSNQISTRDFSGRSIRFNYNLLVRGTQLYGLSLGWAHENNIDDLKQVTVKNQTTIVDGGVTRIIEESLVAWRGKFAEQDTTPIRFDAVLFPAQLGGRIGFTAFAGGNMRSFKDSFLPGFGVFLSEAGKPTNVIGGITFTVKDGNLKGALIAGYNF